MKKIVLSVSVLFVFCCSVCAAISVRETNIALSSALDGTISAVASVTSNPTISLQGISFEYDEDGLPWRVVFTRSDLSSYLEALSFNGSGWRSWYETLLNQSSSTSSQSPFAAKAIEYLVSSGYGKGDVVLDGTITLEKGNAADLGLLASDTSWSGLVLPLSISLMISGSELSSSLIVEGSVEIIGGEDFKITVYSDNLKINGETVSFSPFEVSY